MYGLDGELVYLLYIEDFRLVGGLKWSPGGFEMINDGKEEKIFL